MCLNRQKISKKTQKYFERHKHIYKDIKMSTKQQFIQKFHKDTKMHTKIKIFTRAKMTKKTQKCSQRNKKIPRFTEIHKWYKTTIRIKSSLKKQNAHKKFPQGYKKKIFYSRKTNYEAFDFVQLVLIWLSIIY